MHCCNMLCSMEADKKSSDSISKIMPVCVDFKEFKCMLKMVIPFRLMYLITKSLSLPFFASSWCL